MSINCPVCDFCYGILSRLNPRDGSVVVRTAPVDIAPFQQEGAGKAREVLQKERCDPREDGKVSTQLQKSEIGALGDVG